MRAAPPQTGTTPEPIPGGQDRQGYLSRIFLAATLVLFAVLLVSVWTRYLVNDDYQTLYTAWLKAQGKVAGRDYYLTSYYLLVDLLAPLFKVFRGTWFPIYAARLCFIGVLAGILLLSDRMARILFDAPTGKAIPVVLLSTTALLHRGLDIRPDLITNLLWLGILLQLLSGKALTRRSAFLVGAMVTLVTLNRFKGLLLVPMLAAAYGWLLVKARPEFWRKAVGLLLGLALGAAAILVPYLLWVACTDGMHEFIAVHVNLFHDLSKASSGESNGVMGRAWMSSLRLDYLFWILSASGILLRIRARVKHPVSHNLFLLALLATALLTVILNPAYYAYNFVTLQTLLAPFAAYALLGILDAVLRQPWVRRSAPLLAGFLVAAPILWNWEAIKEVTLPSNRHQKALHAFILGYIPPEKPVVALEGIGLYRPSVFHWRFPAILAQRYASGAWNYAGEMRTAKPELLVFSYRLPGWLTESDRTFVLNHFAPLAPQSPLLWVPGIDSREHQGAFPFELLDPGAYEILRLGPGTCTLDGNPIPPLEVRHLKAGSHLLNLDRTRCIIRRAYPPAAKALVANPKGLPYLSVPELELPPETY